MTGLQSTYGYNRSEKNKANEMLKTGQVPMDLNAMSRNLVTRRGLQEV